ncbi:hypothetical protein EDD15DRAFT_2202780 [Pisolithus albus]|nr:hypothetical protein EDD15DRAFT_2202780 [Pisolithus albus]
MPRLLRGKTPEFSGETSQQAPSHGSKSTAQDARLIIKGKAALRRLLHIRGSPAPASSITTSAAALVEDAIAFGKKPEAQNGIHLTESNVQAAEENFSTMGFIPRPAPTAVSAVGNANTAMTDLCTIDATYLAPLSIFHTVVNNIANMALSALTLASNVWLRST